MGLRPAMLAVGAAVAVWCALGIPARATYGARTTADEPQYLTTALSLWEDGSLDIADELGAERWRSWHEARLPRQTEPQAGGDEVSPHDPLLPALLAAPVGVGGWAGAKAAMAVLAGVLAAALVWVATRRFSTPLGWASVVVLAFAAAAPLAPYGAQIYPELPAALAVTAAIGALTGPLGRGGVAVVAASVAALPWLAVKYAPIAAAVAGIAVVRLWRRDGAGDRGRLAVATAAVGAAGAAFVGLHLVRYGGWTSYASGDHFVGGEFTAVGTEVDYGGRSNRLVGLLVDRSFGLAAWAPAFLFAIPALGALARRRPPGWGTLALPLAAGWLVATFVALTMHGWWWPGRQVVVVVPALVLAVAWWLPQAGARARAGFVAVAAAGVATWAWLLTEVVTERLRLIIDFDRTTNPLYRLWRAALPDERSLAGTNLALHAAWTIVIVVLAGAGWRWRPGAEPDATPPSDRRNTDEDPYPAHPGPLPAARPVAVGGGGVR